jgi:5-methylcytosine-specific restriction endonuclease McrA
MSKQCKWCGASEHTSFYCFKKPRKPIAKRTPINKVGKQGKKTAAAVAKWKRTQNPNHRGNYVCYICSKEIPYLVAEHVKSKARHPDLRTDPNNLKPTCADCNREKGAKDND